MELAAIAGTPVPALVLTEIQTAGRGRGTNVWWSSPGALTFSLILDLDARRAKPESWPTFALAAAVGLCDALETIAIDTNFGVRWPNDVCCGTKKICGILPELAMSTGSRLVLGVGINVNNSIEHAPDELQTSATSLIDITGRRERLTSVLVLVLNALEQRFAELAASDPLLHGAWSDRCLLRGRKVRLRFNSDEVEGRCTGIDATGALGLETRDGIKLFHGGVVAYVGDRVNP
jgi:BirA family biotin operon repressor/biotin-[acetyl-CoA-carboxylase] ligase